jgi:hypothetical protein
VGIIRHECIGIIALLILNNNKQSINHLFKNFDKLLEAAASNQTEKSMMSYQLGVCAVTFQMSRTNRDIFGNC